jgi:hypothetical protein
MDVLVPVLGELIMAASARPIDAPSVKQASEDSKSGQDLAHYEAPLDLRKYGAFSLIFGSL